MSWEGYGQALCKKGHMYVVQAYGDESAGCDVCGEPQAWIHWVDETNGCYCEEGKSDCPAHALELEVKTPAVYKTCGACKHSELVSHATYKIPGAR